MAKKKKTEVVEEEKQEVQDKEETPSDGSIAANDAWTGLLAISLLALSIGTGFLAYDYYQYYDGDAPKRSNLTTTLPVQPKKADEAPPVIAPEKKDGAEKKDGMEKKDGAEKKEP